MTVKLSKNKLQEPSNISQSNHGEILIKTIDLQKPTSKKIKIDKKKQKSKQVQEIRLTPLGDKNLPKIKETKELTKVKKIIETYIIINLSSN
jgi:hypothetical protein